MSARQALLWITLTSLAGCAPGRGTLLPVPEPVSTGKTFAFKEWLPGGTPSFLEGRVTVTEHGLLVTTKQTRCQERPTLPTSIARQFDCGGVFLTFMRDDPTLQARYSYTAVIPGSTSTCASRSWPAGGGMYCGSYRVSTDNQHLQRSGQVRLVPAA